MSHNDEYPGPASWGVEIRFPTDGVPTEELQRLLRDFAVQAGGQIVRRFAQVEMPPMVPDIKSEVDLFSPELQGKFDMSIDDLLQRGDEPIKGQLARIRNRLRIAGLGNARDILLSGKDYLTHNSELQLAEKSLRVIEEALTEKCPEIPYKDYLLPHAMAQFSELSQVPVFALRTISFASGEWNVTPLEFGPYAKRQTVAELVEAREQGTMNFAQTSIAQSGDLDWFVESFTTKQANFPPPSAYAALDETF